MESQGHNAQSTECSYLKINLYEQVPVHCTTMAMILYFNNTWYQGENGRKSME
jgi:hypothetical protein